MLSPVGIRKVKLKKIITGIFLVYLFFSCKVYAIGFGDIKLYSYLNEPLSSEIELVNLNGIELRGLHVDIASAEDFMLAGVPQFFSLNKLKFEVVTAQNKSVIYIWTNDAIQDPFIEFLLKLEWPGGKIVKGFTILLDPPGVGEQVIKRGIPLVLSAEYQQAIQHGALGSDIKVNFPYDAKLAEKINTAAIEQQHIIAMPQADGTVQNSSINTSLTKSGDSLKDLSDGFAVPISEILTPEPLKSSDPVKEKALLHSIAQTVKQATVPKVIEVVEPLKLVEPLKPVELAKVAEAPKLVVELPKQVEPPILLEPSTLVGTPQSLSPATTPLVLLQQQIPMQAVPDTTKITVVKEQDIKVLTNMPKPKLQEKPKPKLSDLLEINEKQVANTVIHKYRFELMLAFLLVVVALLFIVKIMRQRQINKAIDNANEDLLDVVVEEPVMMADEREVMSEVITKEIEIPDTTLAETTISNMVVEDIEILDVPSITEETSSTVNIEAAIRLNLANQYIESGDMNSAKEILDELIKTSVGNDRLKAEALLSTIT